VYSIVGSGVTNLIHDRRTVVFISRLEVGSPGKLGSMCPLKREQARRERDSGL